MKKTLILLIIMFGMFIAEGYAQEAEKTPLPDVQQEEETVPQDGKYVFPDIKPEITLSGGYRFVHVNGSGRAEEFEYLHNSLTLDGEFRSVSPNHRLHLDLDIRNKKDYYGDISYTYKDLILFRGVNSTLFHNLDNITLFDFGTRLSSNKNPHENYGIKVGMNNFLLRFKTPDFPAHLYFEGNFVEKEGTKQQMFYVNSKRTSGKRNIDQKTSVYTVGANSHLGPVEVDLSHSEKRFDVNGDRVLSDYHNTPTRAPFYNAGNYYHNRISELESSTNTLKLHTSYTGRLVASATLSKTDKENRDSGAKADYLFASGDVTWMPMTALTFFVKYRHRETDFDSPQNISVRNLTDSTVYGPYTLRDSISSVSDSVSGTVRFRPFKGAVLKADYSYEEISRDNEDEWHVVPDSTQRQKFSLTGDVRILSGLKLKAQYIHKDNNNPATNMEPDKSDEGIISLSWMPLPRLSTYISYGIKEEKRESLEFLSGTSVYAADNRKVQNDRLIGMLSYALLNNLSLTASYAYMHDNIRQDIKIDPANSAYWDNFVPYKTTSHNYSFDVNYSSKNFISLNGGISHTVSQGNFYTSAPNLNSIAVLSELKIKETTYSVAGEYKFKGGVSAGIRYRYSTFNDKVDNIYNDIEDGRVQMVLLTISKKW